MAQQSIVKQLTKADMARIIEQLRSENEQLKAQTRLVNPELHSQNASLYLHALTWLRDKDYFARVAKQKAAKTAQHKGFVRSPEQEAARRLAMSSGQPVRVS